MNRRLVVVLAVILPVICPAFPQVAQPFPRDRQDSTHIEGLITDRSGNPVELARVVLSAFTSEMGQTSVSDDDGRFAFYGLKEGSYKITRKLDEAQESFNKAIRLNSDNFDALLGLGLVSNDRKQFKEAEEWLLRLASSSNKD